MRYLHIRERGWWGNLDCGRREGLFPCLFWSQGDPLLLALSIVLSLSGWIVWLSGDSAVQVRLHPGHDGTCKGHGRAEAGHHEAEQDPAQALALVHAGL